MLPPEVSAAVGRWHAFAGPGVRGAWVIGSAALGDWWPGASDVDLVAVVDPTLDETALRALHARLRNDASAMDAQLEVLYLGKGDLALPCTEVGARLHHRGGLLRRDAEMCTPVTWQSLAEHGVSTSGAARPAVRLDDAALAAWCRENLGSYWAGWASRGAVSSSRTGMVLLTDWGVAWCVLGVLRLHYTLVTGRVTSKSGAGRWALEAGRGFGDAELIETALSLRGVGEPLPPDEAERAAAAARRERVVAFLRRATVPPLPGRPRPT